MRNVFSYKITNATQNTGVIYISNSKDTFFEYIGTSKKPLIKINRFIEKLESSNLKVINYDLKILESLMLGEPLEFFIGYPPLMGTQNTPLCLKVNDGYLKAKNQLLKDNKRAYYTKKKIVSFEGKLRVGLFASNHYESVFLNSHEEVVSRMKEGLILTANVFNQLYSYDRDMVKIRNSLNTK